jgi:hypothetical protein
MAKRVGNLGAWRIGFNHEAHPGNPQCQMIMDLYNNERGRGAGENGPTTDCGTHCANAALLNKPLGPCNPCIIASSSVR